MITRQMLSDRVERQAAVMARRDHPHHVRLAAGAECRTAALPRLDRDQPVDDFAALHQQLVHLAVDPVDLFAQFGQRFQGGVLLMVKVALFGPSALRGFGFVLMGSPL